MKKPTKAIELFDLLPKSYRDIANEYGDVYKVHYYLLYGISAEQVETIFRESRNEIERMKGIQ